MPTSASSAPAPTTSVKVIKGLYSDVKSENLHLVIPVSDLERLNENFEVLLDGTPCKVFIDVDGEMNYNDYPSILFFREKVAEIEKRLVECPDILGVRNSSHYKAIKYDPKTKKTEEVAKISFMLTYQKKVATCKVLKDYAVSVLLPDLKVLLDGVIEISDKSNENALNVDTSVYRTNGKIRCPNAFKIPQQRDRISKIVKGSVEENLVQIIPDDCPAVSSPIAIATQRVARTPVLHPDLVMNAVDTVVAVQQPTNTTNDNEVITELLKGLNDKRFATYDDWFIMTCVVKEEGINYKLYDDICATKPKYNRASNRAIYDNIQKQGKLKVATLWWWLKQDNKPLFDTLQKSRSDFFKMLDLGIADIDYAKMFYNARPKKYFYSKKSFWWELDRNNRYINETDRTEPPSMVNCVSETLRELLEEQRKNLNPLDEKTQNRSKALLSEYLKVGSAKTTAGVIKYLKDLFCVPDFDKLIDAKTNLLAFTDKVFDIDTGAFRPITPADYISKSCGYEIGDAKINSEKKTLVEKIMIDIFPEVSGRKYFWLCASLAFFTNRFEKLYILSGSGGNGKGILSSYISQAGGEYVLNAEQQFLTTVYKGSQANSCLASCEGKRIVFVSEPDNGEKHSFLNIDFMKMITGRDKISARYLNKNIKEFESLFTTFLSCNTKPEIRKLDKGILRRLSIHPFVCEFRENPNPLNALEKLLDNRLKEYKNDAEFIKTFMLMLLKVAHENKDVENIEMPQESKDAVNEYIEENNMFKVWFEANFTRVSLPEDLKTKEEKDLWRETHSHKTSFVLKEFNRENDTRWDPKQMIQAIGFNGYYMKTVKGYKTLFYYAYNDEASGAETQVQSEGEVEEE
jgi:P4 family phage/plasmid primase-like protien